MDKYFLNIESNFIDLNHVNIDLYKKLSIDFSLKIIFFHKYNISKISNLSINYDNFIFIKYEKNDDLIDKLRMKYNINDIVYVNTFNDLYLREVSDLKDKLSIP